jgi:hypothetical protein
MTTIFFAIYVDLRGKKRYLDLSLTLGDGAAGSFITAWVRSLRSRRNSGYSGRTRHDAAGDRLMANTKTVRIMERVGDPSSGVIIQPGTVVDLAEVWADRYISQGKAQLIEQKPAKDPTPGPAPKKKKK